MNELSLIPATFEFCKNSNIVELKDGKHRTNSADKTSYKNYLRCLYYPEVSYVIESCEHLFSHSNIKELDFSMYNFKNITSFEYMFDQSKVERIIGLNCSDRCTNLVCLCRGCSNLREFNASKLNTKNVQYFGGMFSGCSALQKLDLSNLDFSQVANIVRMFEDCENLIELYLPEIHVLSLSLVSTFHNTPKLNVDNLPKSWRWGYEIDE